MSGWLRDLRRMDFTGWALLSCWIVGVLSLLVLFLSYTS